MNQTFTVTVTAPATVTDAPELVSVSNYELSSTVAILRFTFDEAVRPDVTAGEFVLYAPNTDVPFPASDAVRDPDNDRAVLAQFDRETEYDLANTVAVASGAVTDLEGNDNPEAALPLKSITWAAGDTEGADLVSITNLTRTDTDEFTARFNFDDTVAPSVDPTDYVIVLADSRIIAGAVGSTVTGSNNDKTHTVTFDTQATTSLGGTVCTTPDNCPTANDVVATSGTARAVRGYVTAALVAELQSANISGNGRTTAPDLTGVSLDAANHSVTYTFDQTLDADVNNINEALFYVVYRDGSVAYGDSGGNDPIRASNTTVKITFDDGEVNKAIVYAGVLQGAVEATNAGQSVGVAQVFSGAESLAPVLASATKSKLAGLPGGTSVTWRIVLTFDRDVDRTGVTGDFIVYTDTGDRYVDGGAELDCDPVANSDTKFNCDLTLSGDDKEDVPVLAGLEADTVRNLSSNLNVDGTVYENYEQSRRL